MKLNSFQVKLPLIIIVGYVLTTVLVQFIIESNLTQVINVAKEAEYNEKLQTVLQSIQNNNERLQKTGMVSTYLEDFQKLTLRQLRETYPASTDKQPALFIVTTEGALLMAPPGIEADSKGYSKAILQQTRDKTAGNFTITVPDTGRVWCDFKVFAPWNWTVGYQVPEAMKYQMASQLMQKIWVIFGIGTLLALLLIFWIVRAQLKPIAVLTKISAEMADGQLDSKIEMNRKDEVGLLADNFNRMQQAIKQTITSLRSSEENLQITLDSIGDAVIATDANLQITRMNPVAENLTGWLVREAIGQPLKSVFQIINKETREPVVSPAEEALQSGEIVTLSDNTLLIAKNGREYLIDDSAAPIRHADNRLFGVVLVFRDVTEDKAIQEQLLQSRKMDTIGQLAGGVAHDFNNMLGGIIGSAEILKRSLPEDQKSEKFLDIILESAERSAELTGKLLAFSRKQHVSSTPVDAHAALHNAISLLENTIARQIKIKTDLTASSCTVVGDMSQLQNVFLNLGINAADAMPDGGELTVTTKIIELDKVYCTVSSFDLSPGSFIEIEFRDNGCGIPPEHLNRIFEPFYTTKDQGKGTGLGLSAVLGTIQSHNGEITAYSEIGTGTAFHILLPLTEIEVKTTAPASLPQQGTGLILVIDDEAVMRATAGVILEDLGYEVLLATNGKLGLELFRERQNDIDLVLLDMIMPEMNGRECFARIREIDQTAKVILSSGFTQSDDLADLRTTGLAGFIPKPFRGSALGQIVAEVLADDSGEQKKNQGT